MQTEGFASHDEGFVAKPVDSDKDSLPKIPPTSLSCSLEHHTERFCKMAKASNLARIDRNSTRAPLKSSFTPTMSKELVTALLEADSEPEVLNVINSNKFMSNPDNWIPIAKSENNIATVNNQSADPTKALCEMLTNMVDAVLLRMATERGIDPRSYEAPKSIANAVETFLGWKDGRLTNGFDNMKEAGKWASENLMVAFTGATNLATEPTLVFCDSGEGQHPEDFDRTFMSLGEGGGKRDIKFVQGQYNMGSSGVLGYCGEYGFKLIVSRKHTLDGKWGWSLVRRRPNYDSIVYEYFKVGGVDGQIPFINDEVVSMVYTKDGKPYEDTKFTSGTAVKLFNYRIGGDYRDFDGPRRVFYEHLANSVMPVRLLNLLGPGSKNKGKVRAAGVDARTFCGLEVHISQALSKDHRPGQELLEEEFETDTSSQKGARPIDVGYIDSPLFGKISIRGYFTEDDITSRARGRSPGAGFIRSVNRAFFSVNGQIQHREGRGFLTDCGLPALKDHLALLIDCSNLTPRMHQTIWKSDREAMLVGKTEVKDILKKIKDHVSACQALIDLNNEVQEKNLSMMIDQSAQLIFTKLVKRDPTLARLLNGGLPIAAAIGMVNPTKIEPIPAAPYEGLHSPTYFDFVSNTKKFDLQRGKSLTIRTKTNVADDYFIRDSDRGELVISEGLNEIGVVATRQTIRNGFISVTFTAPANAPIGNIPMTMTLSDRTMTKRAALRLKFSVNVIEALSEIEGEKPKKRERREKAITPPSAGYMTKDGREIDGQKTAEWPEGWDERDGAKVDISREGLVTILINYDCVHLQSHLARASDINRRKLLTKFSLAMQVTCLAAVQQISHLKETQPDITEDETDRLIRNAAAVAASTAIALVDTVPKIMFDKNEEPSED